MPTSKPKPKKKSTPKVAEFELGFHILNEKSGHWPVLGGVVEKFICIDPDSKGCLVIRGKGSYGWGVRTVPLSSLTETELYDLIKSWNCPVFIERQWPRPMEGVSSSFKSGRQYGMVTSMAILARQTTKAPVFFVNPNTWTSGLPKDKSERVKLVNETMPNHLTSSLLMKEHGTADAILFSEWIIKCLSPTKTPKENLTPVT